MTPIYDPVQDGLDELEAMLAGWTPRRSDVLAGTFSRMTQIDYVHEVRLIDSLALTPIRAFLVPDTIYFDGQQVAGVTDAGFEVSSRGTHEAATVALHVQASAITWQLNPRTVLIDGHPVLMERADARVLMAAVIRTKRRPWSRTKHYPGPAAVIPVRFMVGQVVMGNAHAAPIHRDCMGVPTA